jgi:hypothetical protein
LLPYQLQNNSHHYFSYNSQHIVLVQLCI